MEECAWQTFVLIPKGVGYLQRIRLVEVLWKTVKGILNFRFAAAIQFHNKIHGFRMYRGTGTPSLESNLLKHFMKMREEVLYEIF